MRGYGGESRNRDGGPNVQAGMDLTLNDPAVVAAINMVRWELGRSVRRIPVAVRDAASAALEAQTAARQ